MQAQQLLGRRSISCFTNQGKARRPCVEALHCRCLAGTANVSVSRCPVQSANLLEADSVVSVELAFPSFVVLAGASNTTCMLSAELLEDYLILMLAVT